MDILTLFPSMFGGPFDESMIKRAQTRGLLEIHLHDLREFVHDRHRTVDDVPYGGGGGMVMKVEPLFGAVQSIRNQIEGSPKIILLSPQGQTFTQKKARKLAKEKCLLLICGHYEGVDERVRQHLVDEEISVGDYVLTGGELAAMVVIDATTRMLPGVLGCQDSARKDSFYDGLLDYPQYTRPAEFRGWKVPQVLMSGNHPAVERWRREMRIEATFRKRPDLLGQVELTQEERDLVKRIKRRGN
jgi:tRNA (guanine37-N1)-methyltransferase